MTMAHLFSLSRFLEKFETISWWLLRAKKKFICHVSGFCWNEIQGKDGAGERKLSG